jgi:hypothetical protein
MLRSIFAVVAGFVVVFFLSFGGDEILRALLPGAFDDSGRVESTLVLLLIILYVGTFAVAGCYLTARLAPSRPMRHALILGVLGLVFNIAGTITFWEVAPAWYHIVSLGLVLPFAWLGGALRERELAG